MEFIGYLVTAVVFTIVGMSVYHQMLKRNPHMLQKLVDGANALGGKVENAVNDIRKD